MPQATIRSFTVPGFLEVIISILVNLVMPKSRKAIRDNIVAAVDTRSVIENSLHLNVHVKVRFNI